MKKKLTAIITACAMMVTMVPSAVLATEQAHASAPQVNEQRAQSITIQTLFFNNSTAEDTVLIVLNGALKDTRYNCILDGVAEPLESGIISADGEYTIRIPKSKIPNINNPYAANVLTVTITNKSGSQVLHSQQFKQKYASSAPTTVACALRDGIGNTGRLLDVSFDTGYYPSADDTIRIDALNASGTTLGPATIYYGDSKYSEKFTVTNQSLATTANANNMRPLARPLKLDVPQSAASIRVRFFTGSQEMTQFSKTISLAPRYGTLAKLELTFENDEIYRGDKVTGTLYYVNTEGKRYDVSDQASYTYIDGGAIVENANPTKPEFTVKKDAPYGAKLSILCTYGSYEKPNGTVLTVAEKLTTNKVATNRTSSICGQKADVTFTLLNQSGATTTLSFKPTKVTPRLVNASDASAKLSFIATSLATLQTNGTMNAKIDSDKPCTAQIELTFSDDNGNKYRVLTDTYTFRDAKDPEKRKVVLTFGSNDILINGQAHTFDVGPIAYKNRTFVPLRHVAKAFDAECNWDGKTNKITIKYADKTIVMTPGSPYYTLNGKDQKPMDVTPYVIAGINRTMVPLRFVGEALGFQVEAIPGQNGGVGTVEIQNYKTK